MRPLSGEILLDLALVWSCVPALHPLHCVPALNPILYLFLLSSIYFPFIKNASALYDLNCVEFVSSGGYLSKLVSMRVLSLHQVRAGPGCPPLTSHTTVRFLSSPDTASSPPTTRATGTWDTRRGRSGGTGMRIVRRESSLSSLASRYSKLVSCNPRTG